MTVFFLEGTDDQTHAPELQIQSVKKHEFEVLHSDLADVKPWHHT